MRWLQGETASETKIEYVLCAITELSTLFFENHGANYPRNSKMALTFQ